MVNILVLFLMLTFRQAWAIADCSTVDDISKGLGPVYQQATTSWCHVFTTTDCMTQHMLNEGKLKPGDRLHPLRIAAAMAEDHSKLLANATRTTGTPISDFNAVSESTYFDKAPLCTESQLASVKKQWDDLIKEDWQTVQKTFATPQDQSSFFNQTFKAKCHFSKYWINYAYWYNKQRQNATDSANRQPFEKNKASDKFLAGKIDEALKKHELAAIGYDANFILKRPGKNLASHWSSIVGRFKGPDGICYYKVRNSWGPKCADYSAAAHCKNGYFTVSADRLLMRVHTVQYFTDSNAPASAPYTAPYVNTSEIETTISH
jgi:hypothetical protein